MGVYMCLGPPDCNAKVATVVYYQGCDKSLLLHSPCPHRSLSVRLITDSLLSLPSSTGERKGESESLTVATLGSWHLFSPPPTPEVAAALCAKTTGSVCGSKQSCSSRSWLGCSCLHCWLSGNEPLERGGRVEHCRKLGGTKKLPACSSICNSHCVICGTIKCSAAEMFLFNTGTFCGRYIIL